MVSYKRLREKMITNGLRWKEVRQAMGISSDVVTKINKDQYISLQSLEKFARYFKCDIGDLIELKDDLK